MREATFTLGGFTFGEGTNYPVTGLKGLPGAPDVRQTSVLRPQQDGAYGGAGFYGTRPITIEGHIFNDAGDRAELWSRTSALVSALTPKDLTTLAIAGVGVDLVTAVRAAGPVTVAETNVGTLTAWQAQLEALDPRLYAADPASAVTGLPGSTGSGVTFPMTSPITFGVDPIGGILTVTNTGTVDTPWTATITGPVTDPRIEHVELGRVLALDGVVDAGSVLELDAAARTVQVDGVNRYSWLTAPRWFLLPPGPSTIRFAAGSGVGATLTFEHRSAWL